MIERDNESPERIFPPSKCPRHFSQIFWYNSLDFTNGLVQMANLTISMSAEDKAGISKFCEATGFTMF